MLQTPVGLYLTLSPLTATAGPSSVVARLRITPESGPGRADAAVAVTSESHAQRSIS